MSPAEEANAEWDALQERAEKERQEAAKAALQERYEWLVSQNKEAWHWSA